MICKNCNMENEDNAEYCIGCGKELFKICRHCGVKNNPEAVFCNACGEKLGSKPICPKCGAELIEGAEYCILCGAQVNKKKAEVKDSDLGRKVSKIMRIISYSVAILLASLVIIFTLFTGIMNKSGIDLGYGASQMDMFFFFGTVYKNLIELAKLDAVNWTDWLMVVLSTLICAGALISSVTLSIIAIVRCGKTLAGKDNGGANFAVLSFLIYLIEAVSLLAIWNFVFRYSEASALVPEMEIKLNGATVAGLIVCSVTTITYIILTILGNGKKQLNKSFIINGSLCIAAFVISVVMTILFTLPMINLSYGELAYGESAEYGLSSWYFIKFVLGLGNFEKKSLIIVLCLISFIAFVYAAVKTIVTLGTEIKDLTGGNSAMKGSFGAGIKIFIAVAISFALTVVSVSLLKKSFSEFYLAFGTQIGLLILGVIELGIGIARKVCLDHFDEDINYKIKRSDSSFQTASEMIRSSDYPNFR